MPLFFIGPLIWIVLLILLIAFIASNIVIVPQARACISRCRCSSASRAR